MKNKLFRFKSASGFAAIFLMLLMPVILALLTLIYKVVYVSEFKSEIRYRCITGSLAVQKRLQQNKMKGLNSALLLLQELQSIISPIKYYVTLTDYPDYESPQGPNAEQILAYRVNYSWFGSELPASLTCGIRFRQQEAQWQNEPIYTTSAAKF